MSSIEGQGKRARERGEPETANPYGEDRPRARYQWAHGWLHGNPALAVSYLSPQAVRGRQRSREKYLRRLANRPH